MYVSKHLNKVDKEINPLLKFVDCGCTHEWMALLD